MCFLWARIQVLSMMRIIINIFIAMMILLIIGGIITLTTIDIPAPIQEKIVVIDDKRFTQ